VREHSRVADMCCRLEDDSRRSVATFGAGRDARDRRVSSRSVLLSAPIHFAFGERSVCRRGNGGDGRGGEYKAEVVAKT
jgi:hypothetical protein